MKTIGRFLFAFSMMLGVACVAEPFEPEPGDELGTEASELAVVEDGFADEGVLDGTALAPVCGDGAFYYYDWVCSRHRGWELVRVGEEPWSCVFPYRQPLEGKKGACRVKDMQVCGGTEDVGQCSGDTTGPCLTPPTTPCHIVLPPPPPPPPILK